MDEFGGDDGIDWSTVQLPSASASNVVPRAAPVNNSGGTAAGPSANNHTSHSAGYHNPPRSDHGDTMAGRDHHHFNASMGNNRTASNNFSSLAGNNGDVDSLRRQVSDLPRPGLDWLQRLRSNDIHQQNKCSHHHLLPLTHSILSDTKPPNPTANEGRSNLRTRGNRRNIRSRIDAQDTTRGMRR